MVRASNQQVWALLDRYQCPVAFHEVRTRFLGNIASPVLSGSPIETAKALWGGELPVFESIDAANELLGALVMGLWNRLTRHQARGRPSDCCGTDIPATREGLGQIALVRRQEIDGFLEGLLGGEESIDLPERAQRGLNVLFEIRTLLEGTRSLAIDWTKPASSDDIAGTIRSIGKLTTIAEQEMHATVLSCARAPSDALGNAGTKVGVALTTIDRELDARPSGTAEHALGSDIALARVISCTINDTPLIGHIAHRARTGAAEK